MTPPKRGAIAVAVGFFLVVISSFSASAVGGCYIYPGGNEELYCVSGVQDTEAAEDCGNYPGCSWRDHFLPGYNCEELSECEQIICTVDCQPYARGVCEELGGQAVPDELYAAYCSPGCCKIGTDQFCQFGLNQYQCLQRARQLGYEPTSPHVLYDNSAGMTLAECNRLYCQVEVTPAQLTGTVYDADARPVAGAVLTLEGTEESSTADSSGNYRFTGIRPGTIVVQVVAEGYTSLRQSIAIAPGAVLQQDFTLALVTAAGSISGRVQADNRAVASAAISWSGPASGRVFTDGSGNYRIENLPAGEYRLTASKIGLGSAEAAVIVSAGEERLDFALREIEEQGLFGTTFIDENGNGLADAVQEFRYGVRLYVDGIFRGFSQYADGRYTLNLPSGEHQLSASYQNYYYGPQIVTVATGRTEFPLLLTRYLGECTPPNPLRDVELLSASPIPGEKEVLLEWRKPCPEVIGYRIEKRSGEQQLAMLAATPAQSRLLDSEVEWGGSYTYAITAIYREGTSPNAVEATITLGDQDCEGRFREQTGWDTFCIVGDAVTRKTVWTCTHDNELIPALNCAERDGEGQDFYCALVDEGVAECKDAGICSIQGYPFGLYSTRDACYGTATPPAENFCSYDYSGSILNECQSCIEVTSCFDYSSKDACEFNSCLDKACRWVDAASNTASNTEALIDYGLINLPGSVTPETGHGYCVEEEYGDDDRCLLCSPQSTLFENYYCTAQVCTGLGKCFSQTELDVCEACGDVPRRNANCYTYVTEPECTGGRAMSKSPFAEITLSDDQCDWGRCLWLGAPAGFGAGACVKDGDADLQDDCSSFTSGGERLNCELDTSPPHTKVVPEGVNIISLASPEITFLGDDDFHTASSQNNKMGALGYCLVSANVNAQSVCTEFTEVPYPGDLKQETLVINLINSSHLQRSINGEVYRLKFYSKDKYHNQENLQETFVFVDNVPPQFEVNERINTEGDITTLTAYLEGITEPMGCSFTLTSLVPEGSSTTREVSREAQNKEVTFNDLPGMIYKLEVTCNDATGNQQAKTKTYTFDLEERIDIISPALGENLAETALSFEIATASGALCSLYDVDTNEKVADFISDEEGKQHHTPPLSGFIEGEYAGTHKALCRELLTEETYEDYFHFRVDFTPPKTIVVLREGLREERPSFFGWEEFFIREVQADFECLAEGFACEKTWYCLGNGCDYLKHPGYVEYTGSVEITESSLLCYYSTDTANNRVYSPVCGDIVIDGYGITLLHPPLHYYQEEQWGVSSQPVFDWTFITKVPTEECGFDFVSSFDYQTLPGFKTLFPDGSGKYTFPEFPLSTGSSPYPDAGGVKSVYVICKNAAGEIGPEQKMSLEYDPTAPTILSAYAEPELLAEGTEVELFATTDDKTLCKYSDAGHEDYDLMNYAFPGAEADLAAAAPQKKILQEEHQDTYTLAGFRGLTRQYSINTLCRNGAGEESGLKTIAFAVDYTQLGGILSVWPQGDYLTARNITLSVETSKNAVCEYKREDAYQRLDGSGGRFHSATISTTEEKFYKFPVRCALGDHVVEDAISFTIDRTPPTVNSVVDGNYTCGSEHIRVMVYTDESNLSAYYYGVYDFGNVDNPFQQSLPFTNVSSFRQSSFGHPNSLFRPEALVFNNTVSPELPIEIPVFALNQSRKYGVTVQARDMVGLWSQPQGSDGIAMVPANFSACTADTAVPLISSVSNESCTAKQIELHCEDSIGCRAFRYGRSLVEQDCSPTIEYNGQHLPFTLSGWVCYYGEDYAGRNHSSRFKVLVEDEDGDTIMDSCDLCAGTAAGAVTDEDGCAASEVSSQQDSDGDGLPDVWEKLYDQFDCPLNFASVDSDSNGIPDGEDDYDLDEYSNYEEYSNRQDPCVKDMPSEEQLSAVAPPSTIPEEAASVLAWVLLILGWLLVLGGTGYLIYYYRHSAAVKQPFTTRYGLAASREELPKIAPAWVRKWQESRKGRKEKGKARERAELFGTFTQSSASIPHLGVLLKKKSPLAGVQQAAQTYQEHKEEIKQGLRAGEKEIFATLGDITRQTKNKDITEVLSKSEAESIFTKLQNLAKKRKRKG